MTEVISQRISKLRKHLSERLGKELTHADLSEMTGLSIAMIQRMESGLNGTVVSLITLLNFYQTHGYNINWILSTDNSQLPMIISTGNELQDISQDMANLGETLQAGLVKLNDRLRNMGYFPLEGRKLVESGNLPDPVGLT